MKRISSLVIATLFSVTLYGQGFQAGLRSGVGYTYYNIYNTSGENKTYTWDKGLFVRYVNNSGWAFELNTNHYNYSDGYIPCNCQCQDQNRNIAGRPYENTYRTVLENAYELNTAAQYNLVCKKMKESCKMLSKLDYYMGTTVGISHTRTKTITDFVFTDEENPATNQSTGYGRGQTVLNLGLINTIVYQVTPKISINNTISASAPPYNMINFRRDAINNSGLKLSCTLGLAYKL